MRDLLVNKKIIIYGTGSFYDMCCNLWQDSEDEYLNFDSNKVDLANIFEGYSPAEYHVFVAIDNALLGLSRSSMLTKFMEKGYRIANLISKDATIGDRCKIGMNCFVGPGVTIRSDAVIPLNTIILKDSTIGQKVKIGMSGWIGSRSYIGDRVTIGKNVTILNNVVIEDDTKIGNYCIFEKPETYSGEIAENTFHLSVCKEPVKIYSF